MVLCYKSNEVHCLTFHFIKAIIILDPGNVKTKRLSCNLLSNNSLFVLTKTIRQPKIRSNVAETEKITDVLKHGQHQRACRPMNLSHGVYKHIWDL